jgi:uncharacterized protein YndB with AHSA1/START domain
MSADAKSGDFVISRVFDAPRELMWKCFTDPERMKQWWGPKGSTVVASKMDLRIGGTYHYGLRTPDGKTMWGKFVYREIAVPQRLVWVNSFSDEAGGITRHPLSPGWPLQLLTTVTFEDQPGGKAGKERKTGLTIRWSPLDATADERKTFDAGHDSMRGGWGGTLDQLAAYLAVAGASTE